MNLNKLLNCISERVCVKLSSRDRLLHGDLTFNQTKPENTPDFPNGPYYYQTLATRPPPVPPPAKHPQHAYTSPPLPCAPYSALGSAGPLYGCDQHFVQNRATWPRQPRRLFRRKCPAAGHLRPSPSVPNTLDPTRPRPNARERGLHSPRPAPTRGETDPLDRLTT